MRKWKYETATDHDVPPGERFQSIRREKGMFSSLAHAATMATMWTYFRLYHRMKVIGRDKLPTTTPFIICSNHVSHADAMVLACTLPPAVRIETYMIAAGDVFFSSPAASALSATLINALPLWRKKVTTHALEELRQRLILGHGGLILFPEGQRSRDGNPGKFKPGVGMIVAGTNVPVYPCHLEGPFQVLPPGTKVPRPHKITVRVGDPLRFDHCTHDRHGWEQVAETIRASIGKLAPGGWTDQVEVGSAATAPPP
jgi:1-acyl-sn-glycerol-3-phosphate acyltransferase